MNRRSWLAGAVALVAAGTLPAQLEKPFRVEADGKAIDVEIGHAHPFVYDFDGDGTRDLLVGQFGQGRLRIYPNTGTNSAPKFGAFTWFEAGGAIASVKAG